MSVKSPSHELLEKKKMLKLLIHYKREKKTLNSIAKKEAVLSWLYSFNTGFHL
jgi:hypothetical protein